MKFCELFESAVVCNGPDPTFSEGESGDLRDLAGVTDAEIKANSDVQKFINKLNIG